MDNEPPRFFGFNSGKEFTLYLMAGRMKFIDTHIETFSSICRLSERKFKAAAYVYFSQVKNYEKDYFLDYFGNEFFYVLRTNPELKDPIWVDLNASLFDKAVIERMKKDSGL